MCPLNPESPAIGISDSARQEPRPPEFQQAGNRSKVHHRRRCSTALRRLGTGFCCGIFLFFLGCGQEMDDQRRLEPQERSDFFADHVATRPLMDFVVQADASTINSRREFHAVTDRSAHNEQKSDGQPPDGQQSTQEDVQNSVPPEILKRIGARKLLDRGQQRFNIHCAPCHDHTGSGNGMVPRRGYMYPPSYHTVRLRQKSLGYFFSIATQGRGRMPAYGDFISVDDRWAIAAYVRALQVSQYASIDQLTAEERQQISNVPTSERDGSPQNR